MRCTAACADLDAEVGAIEGRPLAETAYPCALPGATFYKACGDEQAVSQEVETPTEVAADVHR